MCESPKNLENIAQNAGFTQLSNIELENMNREKDNKEFDAYLGHQGN